MDMPEQTKTEDLSILSELCNGIRVRSGEADIRRRVALDPPGRLSIPAIRAQNELNAIEQQRRVSLSRLRPYTRDLQAEGIEKLRHSGILDALIELQTWAWCPSDIRNEAYAITVSVVTMATAEQVRDLVEKGCIRVLCDSPAPAMAPALRRILELGETERAETGCNPYVDQIKAYGALDWLKRSRQAVAKGTWEHEIDQVLRLFELAIQNSDQDASDRSLGWRPLYPFLTHQRFPKWDREASAELAIEETCPLTMKLFISHRWATPEDPDPGFKHLPMVVMYLSRVFMLANGFIGEDSLAIKDLVIGDSLREAFYESRLGQCRCGSVGWLDVKNILGHDDLFFTKVPDIMRRRNFYRLLKHVRVWYDYSSLPQARGTKEDEEFLDHALSHLANIVGGSEVLALWGIDSIRRAWCIFEVLAARKVHFCAPEAVRWGMVDKVMLKWALNGEDSVQAEELSAYQGRSSLNILIQVNEFKRGVTGLSESEIYTYLIENGLECTKTSDFRRLANLIFCYLNENREANHAT